MKKIACIAGFLILFLPVNSQDKRKDSLLQLLLSGKKDSAEVMTLLRLSDIYENNNQDSAIYYLEAAKSLSQSLNFLKGTFHYYSQSAIVSFTKGDYTASMDQSKQALAIAKQLQDTSFIINMLNNISIVYSYFGDFETQLDFILQAKEISESFRDSSKLPSLYHSLSNVYYNLNQYRKSTDYALLSLMIYSYRTKENDHINRLYSTLGQNYEAMKMYDSAQYYYNNAIKESVRLNDKYAEGTIYGYMVNLYAKLLQFEKMLEIAEKSLSLARQLQSRQMVASSLYNTAFANLLNNIMPKAKQDINEALAIATKDTLRDELKNIYSILSHITMREGNFKTFLWATKMKDSIEQVLINEQVIKSTNELEKKYETEKKQAQISQLKSQTLEQQFSIRQKNILNYLLMGSAIFFIIISLLSYRNYQHKQKLQQLRIAELETEKQLTATEAVLKGEEQERTRLAKDLHDGLGGMLSGIKYSLNALKGNFIMTPDNAHAFERSMDMLDSSIMEMRRVAHNMMPEALVKFGLDAALKDFCYDINQSGALQVNYQSIGMEGLAIEQSTALGIYRIVQELLNNVVKHAAAKNAIVQLSKTSGEISITVEDDGKGFDTAILKEVKGVGWHNIQSRVEYLKGRLDIQSIPGKGTSIMVEINLNNL